MAAFNFKKRTESKATRILAKIQSIVGGDLRISRAGVPHLVINDFYSVAYFCRNKELAIWTHYGTVDNHKIGTFKTYNDVINYFKCGWKRLR